MISAFPDKKLVEKSGTTYAYLGSEVVDPDAVATYSKLASDSLASSVGVDGPAV